MKHRMVRKSSRSLLEKTSGPCVGKATWIKRLRQQLVGWFETNAQPFPWRKTKDPYAIWVSEVMLQQTQTTTVLKFYPRFLARFPDVASLAHAPLEEILKLWEGLGYYRRAIHLHRAAHQILTDFGGQIPRELPLIERLPGVGRYTARAIASIAFGQRVPVLDGNCRRVLVRLINFTEPIGHSRTDELLWEIAAHWVDPQHPGEFNQAMMELGSRVCVPRNPCCSECPLQQLCRGRRLAEAGKLPVSAPRPPVIRQQELTLLLVAEDRLLMWQYADKERWGGLWDFPRIPLTADSPLFGEGNPPALAAPPGAVDPHGLRHALRQLSGCRKNALQHLGSQNYSVTVYRIRAEVFLLRLSARKCSEVSQRISRWAPHREKAWISRQHLRDLALTRPARKLADELARLFEGERQD